MHSTTNLGRDLQGQDVRVDSERLVPHGIGGDVPDSRAHGLPCVPDHCIRIAGAIAVTSAKVASLGKDNTQQQPNE